MRREMVSPACSPDWSATEPSCGRTWSVFVSVIAGDVADQETRPDGRRARDPVRGDAVARCSSIPSDWTRQWVRLEARAPDERMRIEHLARLESVTRVGGYRLHELLDEDLDRHASRAPPSRSSRRSGLNIAKRLGAGLDQDDRAPSPEGCG